MFNSQKLIEYANSSGNNLRTENETDNGQPKENIIQGIDTHHNKDGLIL